MAEILEVEIIAKLDGIQKSLDQIDKKAQGAGKKAGSSFGNAFVSIAQSVLATISFNAVIGGISRAAGAYRELTTTQLSLGNSIEGLNRQTRASNEVLNDSNSTLIQKARALGINIEQYEKTTKAAGGAGNASKSYKINLVAEERALESKNDANEKEIDSIKESIDVKKQSIESINKNISALEDERDVKLANANATDEIIKKEDERIRKQEAQLNKALKAITTSYDQQFGAREIGIKQELLDQNKILNGYKTQERSLNDNRVANAAQLAILLNQREAVQNKVEALREEQSQINLNRESEVVRLELQQFSTRQAIESDKERLISTKEVNAGIKEDYTKQVENQKKEIKTVQTSIEELQKTIEDKQAKFDIDTTPAKKKIEELKDQIQNINLSSSGGGGGGSGKKEIDTKGLQGAVDAGMEKRKGQKEISGVDVGNKVDAMYEKLGGTVTKATLTGAFTNVFQGGIKDADEANTLIEQYVDSASNGKAATISLNQAVGNLSESFRTGNSVIGNLSGITQNYSEIDKVGFEIMKERGETQAANSEALSKEELARARMLGTLKSENIAQGDFAKKMAAGAFVTDQMNAKTLELEQNIGKALTPAYNEFLKAFTPVIEGFTKFVKENPRVVVAIAGIALALTGLLTAVSVIGSIVSVFGVFSTAITGFGALFATGGTLAGVGVFFGALKVTIATFFGGLAALITLPVALIIGAIALMGAAFYAYQNNLFGIKDKVDEILKTMGGFFSDLWKGISEGTAKNWEFLSTSFSEGWRDLTKSVSGGIASVGKFFSDGYEVIKKSGTVFWTALSFIFNTGFELIKIAVDSSKETVVTAFGSIWEAVKNGATTVFDGIKISVEAMINTLIGGINQMIQAYNNMVKGLPDKVTVGSFEYNLPKLSMNELAPVKFANGGIVGGGSYYGDRVPAMVNSGEMILNRMQQAKLFAMANGSQNNSKNVTINQSNSMQGNQPMDQANKQLAFLVQNLM